MGTITPPPALSPSGSMAGWNFLTLLKANKDKLKILVSAIGTYVTAQIGFIQDPNLNALASTAIGVLVYIGLCAVDYWLSDVPVEPPIEPPATG